MKHRRTVPSIINSITFATFSFLFFPNVSIGDTDTPVNSETQQEKNCILAKLKSANSGSEQDAETCFPIIADGVADNTQALQVAINFCSEHTAKCSLPRNRTIRITRPIFMWGNADLHGGKNSSLVVDFSNDKDRFVLNLGIKDKKTPGALFSGVVSNLSINVKSGPTQKGILNKKSYPVSGRVVQFWRASGAVVRDSFVEINGFMYSGTGSIKDRGWLDPKKQTVTDISILSNTFLARTNWHGEEGIAFTDAKNILIEGNKVIGVGDDPLALHFVKNVKVVGNLFAGTDGRVLVENSSNISIDGNRVIRYPSLLTGNYHQGAALIAIWHEVRHARRRTRADSIRVVRNELVYPGVKGDSVGAISIRGAKSVTISANRVLLLNRQTSLKYITVECQSYGAVNGRGEPSKPQQMDAENIRIDPDNSPHNKSSFDQFVFKPCRGSAFNAAWKDTHGFALGGNQP